MTSFAVIINGRILTINSRGINSSQNKNLSNKNENKEVHSLLSGVKEPGLQKMLQNERLIEFDYYLYWNTLALMKTEI